MELRARGTGTHERPGVERHVPPVHIPVGAYRVYDHGGRHAAADAPLVGDGGGWLATADRLEYDLDVAKAGPYDLTLVTATPERSEGAVRLVVDGDQAGRVAIPSTGGPDDWASVTTRLDLPAGLCTLSVVVARGGWTLGGLELR